MGWSERANFVTCFIDQQRKRFHQWLWWILKQSSFYLSFCLDDIFWKKQKQPLEVFYGKRWSQKFCNIHRKTSVLESLFNKIAVLKVCNLKVNASLVAPKTYPRKFFTKIPFKGTLKFSVLNTFRNKIYILVNSLYRSIDNSSGGKVKPKQPQPLKIIFVYIKFYILY